MILSRKIISLIVSSLMLCLSPQVLALGGDSDQPMQLEADSLSIDEATGVILYEGNVEISQGSLKLWADRLWIHRRQGKTEKIVCEGEPSRFRRPAEGDAEEIRGEARRMELYAERDEIVLIDEAVLEQGGSRFKSDRIIYNRTNATVRAGASAEGKQRIQVVIEPERETAP
ncbi:MAG: lipopolysaccharide transport periplasmic protein LptA [Candidatus Thiodiazotropha sp. (ex Dulcina madagascariensis)]|nr:lipopolysaccharide transport periplasmic protein LptA [Candidatus Thiodiazotropha sp. (ex Dulcina madagascariensis)]